MSELARRPEAGARRIAVDLDGVLVDFIRSYNLAFIELAGEDRFGTDALSPDFPPLWDYPLVYGYTPEQNSQVIRDISKSKMFWRFLWPLPEATEVLDRLGVARLAGDDIVFLTTRPGQTAKLQTEEWLRAHGFDLPTVIITPAKGLVCAALGVHLFIDDKLGNVNDVRVASPGTRVYLLDRPYNAEGIPGNDAQALEAGVKRVETVRQMLDEEGL